MTLSNTKKIGVIIPAFNEEDSIGKVVNDIPKELVSEIVVCNNGSTDSTALVAKNAGATVLFESKNGYGNACLAGITYFEQQEVKPDIIVFLDGDYSDYPGEMVNLVREIVEKDVDLVIGSRASGQKEKGSMTAPQIFGNWLATNLMHLFYGVKFTDLGPFRAIKWDALMKLKMQDKTYGWTIEMQLKAIKSKMKTTEIPVNYRKRIGVSKVSGTVKGSILAGYKILTAIFKYL
ncbi:MAG: glycosyltransferase involved in cell wall biosynthesis [Saprospiraceae bacterium]